MSHPGLLDNARPVPALRFLTRDRPCLLGQIKQDSSIMSAGDNLATGISRDVKYCTKLGI
jgi:hypothetical protein